jgi:hypothetical protein
VGPNGIGSHTIRGRGGREAVDRGLVAPLDRGLEDRPGRELGAPPGAAVDVGVWAPTPMVWGSSPCPEGALAVVTVDPHPESASTSVSGISPRISGHGGR